MELTIRISVADEEEAGDILAAICGIYPEARCAIELAPVAV